MNCPLVHGAVKAFWVMRCNRRSYVFSSKLIYSPAVVVVTFVIKPHLKRSLMMFSARQKVIHVDDRGTVQLLLLVQGCGK